MIGIDTKKGIVLSILFCIILSSQTPVRFLETEESNSFPFPEIQSLEMFYPPGYEMGTFDSYIASHPYKSTIINYINNKTLKSLNALAISILIDSKLYKNQLITDIDEYIEDLIDEGYTITSTSTITGGTPEEIKQWIKNQYNQGSTGIVFIGDIAAAWAEVSGDQFPCDLFYMDLDGEWVDSDNDEIYDEHDAGSGDMGPEVYVGRLYTSTLHWESDEQMLSDYFDKIHRYRTGELTQPFRGLEYIEEDWYDMDVHLDMVYNTNVSHFDFGYRTTADDYLSNLEKGQHFVQVCAHSYPQGHHFGRRPTEAVSYLHSYVYSPVKREAKIMVGSDDGVKVWLNGEKILEKDVYTGWVPDQYRNDVTLNQGWNSLLCKVSQENGDYDLSVRFTDKSMQALTDLKFQTNNPIESQTEAPFIRSWLVNGFHRDSQDNFWNYLTTNYLGEKESEIIPFEGEEMGGKTWSILKSGCAYIDLNTIEPTVDFGVNYAFVTINSQETVDCELWMGYDDGVRVWLNNQEIFLDNRYGEYISDMSKIPITLQAGQNHLLLKVSEWMGTHGFSARICTSDGEQINGLSYTPEPSPITYIGEWLIAGTFENADVSSRLSTEYIPNEAMLQPTKGDTFSSGTWEKAIGNGHPFDINSYFDHGDWVDSQTIQEVDPPCLFYNLFACGPGRFTDEDYLAGSYIFDTTYGLISIASAKSGSMLVFEDFYKPLGQGKSIGESFKEWFNSQAPFALWEKEWFYGMMICGDPTLTVFSSDNPRLHVDITKPTNGFYIKDSLIFPFIFPVIFGNITLKAEITNPGYGIASVTFLRNDEELYVDTEYPYEYVLDQFSFGKQKISVRAIDIQGQINDRDIMIWKFF